MVTKIKDNREGIIYYILLILFTACIGYISLGKGFDFNIYPSFEGDSILGMTLIKSIQENGVLGVLFNSRIGAPETSILLDYPVLGNVMVLLLWMIALFVKSTPAIMYVYLIVTFILDGVSMSMLLRKIGINRETSFAISSLFSFAPYHFYRYVYHSSLSNYMFVPIAIYLSLCIIGYIEEMKRVKIIICAVILGLGYGYYYAFGLIIMAVAYIIKFIKLENKKDILKDIWIIILVLATILLTLLPKIGYGVIYGSNTVAGQRVWAEQEIYGLKIINLLLPVSYSRIGLFKALTNEYITKAPLVTENVTANLGIIGSIGFIILCIALIISFVNKEKCCGREWKVIDYLSLSVLTLVLVGTVGGFGEIFNWAVTSQIRCYNRSSIVIMAFCLIMIAILLNKVALKRKRVSYELCVLILAFGMYDQVNILNDDWQKGVSDTQKMYETYFSEVEAELPEAAMVYQLPYMDFPEAGNINNLGSYELFTGYLFTDNLKWSYGGVKGRNLETQKFNMDNGMSYAFLYEIRQAGFQAVYIDTNGYADKGKEILAFYNNLNLEPIVSKDQRMYVYDISAIDIPDFYLCPGYGLVKTWALNYQIEIQDKDIAEIARGLSSMDVEELENIYSWFMKEKAIANGSDDEFVEFLYFKLLGRVPSEEEKESWIQVLESGTYRQDVFNSFLKSSEFRSRYGLNELGI